MNIKLQITNYVIIYTNMGQGSFLITLQWTPSILPAQHPFPFLSSDSPFLHLKNGRDFHFQISRDFVGIRLQIVWDSSAVIKTLIKCYVHLLC